MPKEEAGNKSEGTEKMTTIINEIPKTSHFSLIRKIAQETIQKKGLTVEQVKQALQNNDKK